MTKTETSTAAIVQLREGENALALLLGADATPIGVRHGTLGGTLLDGVFVESADGALSARLSEAANVRRVEIPAAPAERQSFFAAWSAQSSMAQRGIGIGLLLLPLAACGGGGGGGTSTVATTTTGFVIDGYIAGATVFRDADGDRQLDVGEVSTTSGTVAPNIGRFTLGGNLSQQIVAFGGTDVSTGAAFNGVLLAPAGATVVTPLTTIVSILMSPAGGGLTQSAALAEVRAALGLNAGDENLILNTDPIATNNIRLAKAGVQLGNILNAVGTAAAGDAAAQQAAAFSVATQLAITIRDAAGTVSLSDLGVLSTAVTNAGVTLTMADREAVAAKNQRLSGADIDTIAEIDTVQQTPTPASISVNRAAQTVTLTFTEQLDATNPPPTSAFQVTTQIGGVATVNQVVSVSVSGRTVTLTLQSPFQQGQVDVSYTDPTAGNDVNAIQDLSGNDAISFTSGRASDGYLRGAQIWLDTNNDGVRDLNTGIVTNANGDFFLPAGLPSGTIVAVGGVNIDTGIPNTVELRAPAGSTTVNPLTTLVQAVLSSNPAIGSSGASVLVAQSLGLSADIDLTRFDPLAVLAGDPTSPEALAAQKAAASVATIVAIAGGSSQTATAAAINSLAGQLTQAAAQGTTVNLANNAVIGTVLTAAGTTGTTAGTAAADALGAIQSASNLNSISVAQAQALDTVAPVAPVSLTATSPTNDTTPTVRVALNVTATDGRAAVAGDVVSLNESGVQIASVVLTASHIAAGFVDVTPGAALAEGSHSLTATITDQAGNTSPESAARAIVIDATAPAAPTIAVVAGNDVVNGTEASAAISGTAEANAQVELTLGGNTRSVTANAQGAWSYTLTSADIDAMGQGAETLSARAIDAAGNAGPSATRAITVDTVAPNLVPVLNSVVDDQTPVTGPLLSGATTDDQVLALSGSLARPLDAGETVVVFDGATRLGAATVAENAWSFTTPRLANGAHSLTIRVEDAAGNLSGASEAFALTVLTDVPAATAQISATTPARTNDTTPTIGGTVAGTLGAGDVIKVFSGATELGTATVGDGGTTWSFTVPDGTPLAAGAYSLRAVVMNAAGNTGTPSDPFALTIDLTAPGVTIGDNAPGVTKDAITYTFTFSEAVTGFDASDVTVTNGTKGAFAAATGADAGRVFTLVVTPTAGFEGNVSVDVAAGAATDAAGNASTAAITSIQAVDTRAPIAPVVATVGGDGTINAAEQTGGAVAITGTAEANARVTITLTAGNSTTRQVVTTAGNDGAWSYTLTNADYGFMGEGTIGVTARASDAAGNLGVASASSSFVVDTVNPSLSTLSLAGAVATGAGAVRVRDNTPDLRFTADAGTNNVQIDWNNDGTFDQTVSGTGALQTLSDPTTRTDGSYMIRVRATDAAGNQSDRLLGYELDTVAPAAADIVAVSNTKLRLSFSESVSSALTIADITATGGTLGTGARLDAIDASGGRARVFELTTGTGATLTAGNTLSVASSKLGDLVGNLPAANVSFTVTGIDNAGPTASLSVNDDTLNRGQTNAVFTIAFNEAVSGFDRSDLSVSSGTLGALVGGPGNSFSISYLPPDNVEGNVTLTLAPTYQDTAGNAGAGSSLVIQVDTRPPTVTVTSAQAALKAGETSLLTFTFSEDPGAFTSSSVVVANGTLGTMSGTGLVRTALFTPNAGVASGSANISVVDGSFMDAAGNKGVVQSVASIAIDTLAPTLLSIGSSRTAFKAGETSTITFTFSEDPGASFTATDVVVSGGSIGAVSGSGAVRTALFTPSTGATGSASVSVAAGTYADLAGNTGSGGELTGLTIDTQAPTLQISTSSAALKAGETSTITFTFSEDPGASFTASDISVSGGQLGSLSGSGTQRTAVFTPGADVQGGTATVAVAAGSYSDAAGNAGAAAAVTPIAVDTRLPSFTGANVSVDGRTLTLAYSETLDAQQAVEPSRFGVVADDLPVAVASIVVAGASLVLTLASDDQRIISGSQVSVSGGSQIRDAAGNSVAAAFVATAATNNSDFIPAPAVTAGNDNANSLTGGRGNDTLDGAGGDDTLSGAGGRDRLVGGAGSDTADYGYATRSVTVSLDASGNATVAVSSGDIDTLVGIENLRGGSNADRLTGNGGDNVLSGNGGNDVLDGAGGSDTADYAYLAAGVTATLNASGTATVVAVSGSDTDTLISIENIRGGAGNDRLVGDATDNVLRGGGGNDQLVGGGGSDTADYGYLLTGLTATLVSSGTATVDAGAGDVDTLIGIVNLSGGAGNDALTGDAVANVLIGNAGLDTLDGAGGNDTLIGGAGDVLRGGEGDDLIVLSNVAPAEVTISGGAGSDTVALRDFASGAAIDLSEPTGFAAETVEVIDLLGTNAARLNLSAASVLALSGTAPLRVTAGSDDTIILVDADWVPGTTAGGFVTYTNAPAGATLLVSAGTAVVPPTPTVFGGTGNDDIVSGGAGNDTLSGAGGNDTLNGLGSVDTLNGGDGNDTLDGGSGNDTLNGDAGNDLLIGGTGADLLNGGAGLDTAGYAQSTVGIVAVLNAGASGGNDGSVTGGGVTDTLTGIEQIIGTAQADTLQAPSVNTSEFPLFLAGAGGNDVLTGPSVRNFSVMADYAFISGQTQGVVVDLRDGIAQDGLGGTDTLTNIFGVRGSQFDDTLRGSDGRDRLRDVGGNDLIDGRGGNDIVDYSQASSTQAVTVNLSLGTATGGMGNDVLISIEDVRGGAGNDVIVGSSGTNTLRGGGGNDFLDGQGGNDTADYGYLTSSLTATLNTTGTLTLVAGTNDTDTLVSIENIIGGSANDLLVGDAATNTLTGGGGNDRLDGGAGSDAADYSYTSTGITATLNAAGTATVSVSPTDVDTLISIENIGGSTGNDLLVGDGTGNVLRGHVGVDVLDGGAGNDTADYAYLGTGVTVTLNSAATATVTATPVTDVDTLISIENVRGGLGDDLLVGDGANNVLRGNAGNDFLDGQGGNDTADYFYLSSALTATLNSTGTVTLVAVQGSDTDTLVSIENIAGGSGNDTLVGDGQGNVLTGNAGNDVLDGAGGNDTLFGGPGDTLLGGDGNDLLVSTGGLPEDLNGGAGTDTLSLRGLAVGTVIDLSNPADVDGGSIEAIDTGDGASGLRVVLSAASVKALSDSDTLQIVASSGETVELVDEDWIAGTTASGFVTYTNAPAGATLLVSTAASVALPIPVVFDGTSDNDTRSGGAGRDTLSGAVGNDVLNGLGSADILNGGDGNDTLDGGSGNDTLNGDSGNDLLIGGAGADQLNGGAGFDTAGYATSTVGIVAVLNAGASGGNDGSVTSDGVTDTLTGIEQITGTAQADILQAPSANTSEFPLFLAGAGGNDVLSGPSVRNFSVMADYAFISGQTQGVVVDLRDGIAQDGLGGTDTLTNIFGVRGSQFDDTLRGTDGRDRFRDVGGNDLIDGRGGTDMVDYSQASSTQAVTVNLGTGTATGGMGNDTLISIEDARGGAGNDVLVGSSGTNTLRGGGGNDLLDGQGGFDTADYGYLTTSLTATLNSAGTATVTAVAGSDVDTLVSIENIIGGSGADLLVGDDLSNTLTGGGGNDQLNGGAGSDTADYSYTSTGITATLNSTGTATVSVSATDVDTLISIENFAGSSGNDRLVGDAADNLLRGNSGNDVLDGGSGTDTVDYGYLSSALTATLNAAGTATLVAVAGSDTDTLIAIENIRGGSANDTLVGDGGGNILRGNAGNDVLNGAGGIDTVDYGYLSTALTATLNAAGTVTLVAVAGSDTDTLISIENIRGGSANDTLVGDGGDNILRGNAGNDLLNGAAGNDTADYAYLSTALTATLNSAGTATVSATTTDVDTLVSIENIRGGTGNDVLVGDAAANVLRGNAGNDQLNGAGGNDTADYAYLSTALTATLNAAGTVTLVAVAGSDTDTLISIENIRGGAANDTLVGDGGDNVLRGNAGNDLLNGAGGNDTADYGYLTTALTATLNAAGTVTLVAVAGSDTDTLIAIENITGGAGNDVLTGDGGANVLTGGGGNDTLSGLGGNDTLIGGVGDTLLGGDGDDVFILEGGDVETVVGGAGNDTVVLRGLAAGTTIDLSNPLDVGVSSIEALDTGDGTSGLVLRISAATVIALSEATDTLRITAKAGETLEFTDSGWVAGAVVDGFRTYTNGATATVLVSTAATVVVAVGLTLTGGPGNDTLSGMGGDDTLSGAGGNDTLTGGTGRDILNGDAGNDRLIGGGGDSFVGGDGNDVLVFTPDATGDSPAALLGGAGTDTVSLLNLAQGSVIDLTDVSVTISGIERVANASKDNVGLAFVVDAAAVERITSGGNTLQIDAGSLDVVMLTGSDWTRGTAAGGFTPYTSGGRTVQVSAVTDLFADTTVVIEAAKAGGPAPFYLANAVVSGSTVTADLMLSARTPITLPDLAMDLTFKVDPSLQSIITDSSATGSNLFMSTNILNGQLLINAIRDSAGTYGNATADTTFATLTFTFANASSAAKFRIDDFTLLTAEFGSLATPGNLGDGLTEIAGDATNDTLLGIGGDPLKGDTVELYGLGGNDRLIAIGPRVAASGGAGNDVFVVGNVNADIKIFDFAAGDTIDIKSLLAPGQTKAQFLASAAVTQTVIGSGADASVLLEYSSLGTGSIEIFGRSSVDATMFDDSGSNSSLLQQIQSIIEQTQQT